MNNFNEQFTRQAQEMFNVAKDARIPENFQALAEESVNRSRDFYQKLNATAQENVNALEEFMLASHAGAKAVGEKVMHNAAVNTESAFDAAQAIARSKTLPAVRALFEGCEADVRDDQQGCHEIVRVDEEGRLSQPV
jgi:hypothetical protein